jgi:hypothetical protein
MSPRRSAAAVLFAVLLASAGASAADGPREQSRAEFRRGVDLAKQGDFVHARAAFESAYGLYPHPSILLNLGIARLRTGDHVGAEQDLARFLADDGGAPAEEIASARSALAEARAHLGTVRVKVLPLGARAKIDDRPVALTPGDFATIRVASGHHELVVEADGHEPDRASFDVEPGKTLNVDRKLTPSTPAGGRPVEPSSDDSSRVIGLSIAGGALVFVGAGAYCGLRARSLADDYNTPGSPSFQNAETRSEGTTLRTLADVSFGVAIVGLAVGAYFFFFAKDSPKPRVALTF